MRLNHIKRDRFFVVSSAGVGSALGRHLVVVGHKTKISGRICSSSVNLQKKNSEQNLHF